MTTVQSVCLGMLCVILSANNSRAVDTRPDWEQCEKSMAGLKDLDQEVMERTVNKFPVGVYKNNPKYKADECNALKTMHIEFGQSTEKAKYCGDLAKNNESDKSISIRFYEITKIIGSAAEDIAIKVANDQVCK